MIEADRGIDLWSIPADAVVITTNGDVNASGRAVMGRGCAKEAKQYFPGIDLTLAVSLKCYGNHAQVLKIVGDPYERTFALISFPVKHHWYEDADYGLIVRSTHELVRIVGANGYQTVVAPRFGCGNGKLSWKMVRPMIAGLLDDRFVIVHK